MPFVTSLEQAVQLRSLIGQVQTCPLKKLLFVELERIIMSFPAETKIIPESDFDDLMEKAIEKAGDEFINLGGAGRTHIVEKLLVKEGPRATIEMVQKNSTELERQVASLIDVENAEKLNEKLSALPLSAFTRLSEKEKNIVSSELQEMRNWRGLASLDRMIYQLNRAKYLLEEKDMSNNSRDMSGTSFDVTKLDSG